jgi:hypothetical protein
MRRVPSWCSLAKPASLSTFRCWERAGRVTGICAASSPTERGVISRSPAPFCPGPTTASSSRIPMGYLPRPSLSATSKSIVYEGPQLVQERQARLLASKSALRVAARVSTAVQHRADTVHTSLGFHGADARPRRNEAPSRVALRRVSSKTDGGCALASVVKSSTSAEISGSRPRSAATQISR